MENKTKISEFIVYGFIAFASYFIISYGYVMSFIFAMIVYNVSNWMQRKTDGGKFNVNLYLLLKNKLKTNIPKRLESRMIFSTGKVLSSTFIVLFILLVSFAIIWLVMTLFDFISGVEFNQLFEMLNTNLNKINETLSEFLAGFGIKSMPIEIAKLREVTINFIKNHLSTFSQAGYIFSTQIVKILIGIVIGGILSFYVYKLGSNERPLTKIIFEQSRNIKNAFNKIFLAQCKISFIDALLTAIYLKLVLPYFNVHLPFTNLIVCLTFIFGLLPIVGNLISNTIIVLVSLKAGMLVAISSLLFLIIIHKLEYFLNAKIIGNQIKSNIIELLIVMIVFEGLFGIMGLIMSTIIYAYIKQEFENKGYV